MLLKALASHVRSGADRLGSEFLAHRHPAERRKLGAVYTPPNVVSAMIAWAKRRSPPARVVDPGAGSGRFTIAAASAFPKAEIIAIEVDPEAAAVLRENLRAARLGRRVRVIVDDYRKISLPGTEGRTLFIGNPPYVRHHDIESSWKRWYANAATGLGIRASQLAGLHLHFFLKTRLISKPGDYGSFITAAEWLDVNYGSALKSVLLDGMGITSLDLFDASADVFGGALTTAVVTCFEVGLVGRSVAFGRVLTASRQHALGEGKAVARASFGVGNKWSALALSDTTSTLQTSEIKLGDFFRVKRGQVTGANSIWVAGENASGLPEAFLLPTVTRARELIEARGATIDPSRLRRVIDLPADLIEVGNPSRNLIEKFLSWAQSQGARQSYVATHRKAWWSVGLYEPAPILCTYMGRRSPVFVRNLCQARHLNIAHGLYPRRELDDEMLDAATYWLNKNVAREWGRTYAGGLTKFEPRELERVPLARPDIILREYRDELERRRTEEGCRQSKGTV